MSGQIYESPEATEAAAVARVTREAAKLQEVVPDRVMYASTQQGHLIDLEQYAAQPTRPKGAFTFTEADSLERYVVAHRPSTMPSAYANAKAGSITVVLDDHFEGDPGWGEWRATLSLQHTPEWTRWTAADRTMMTQETFAEHIEDSTPEIVEPSAATMLELAQSFHATTKATFGSAIRLDSGQVQFTYSEDVQAKAGKKGDLLVPQRFMLALAPFVGGQPYKVVARLRYRLHGDALTIGYALERTEDVVREAFDEVVEHFTQATALAPYHGASRSR